MSDKTGFEGFFAREGRAGDAFASTPPEALVLPGAVFLGSVMLLPGPMLCLADGNRIFEGLSLASETLPDAKDEAKGTDARGREGNRSLDTGCVRRSFPFA